MIIDSFQFFLVHHSYFTCLLYFNYSFTTPGFPANLQGWIIAYISILQRCCQAMLEKLWNHINLVHYNISSLFPKFLSLCIPFKSPPVSLRSLILNSTAPQCHPRAIVLHYEEKKEMVHGNFLLISLFSTLKFFHPHISPSSFSGLEAETSHHF